MIIGDVVDDILKNSVSLEFKRFIVFSEDVTGVPVPVDFLKAMLEEEHKVWVANMARKGN